MSADVAAALITFYFIGMTVGRLLSGLLTIKYSDWQIIFSGQAVIFVAIILLLMQTKRNNHCSRSVSNRTWKWPDIPQHYASYSWTI